MNSESHIIFIAPNVGEQMGGEAMKALNIYLNMRQVHSNAIQITHERNVAELSAAFPDEPFLYVKDTTFAKFLWAVPPLRKWINVWFCRAALKLAGQYINEKGLQRDQTIVHQTEPNSPVMPRFLLKGAVNIFGPINGNIYYPACFRSSESKGAKLRRLLHFPGQAINRVFFRGACKADLLLIAGGERTLMSMVAGGCDRSKMLECLDYGLGPELLDRPRIEHKTDNGKYVHFGRLVFHKGTALAIEAVARAGAGVTLDVVGRGPERESCMALAKKLGVESRVNFLDWYESRDDLINSLSNYRGMILPTVEDANGIVVQEAMALGLPCICLDWGGPQLLVQHKKTGYLVQADQKGQIVNDLAKCMEDLAADTHKAEAMSIAGRERAMTWRWEVIMDQWLDAYRQELDNKVSEC